MNYINLDLEITPLEKGENRYTVNASLKGKALTSSTFRHPRTASEETAIDLQEWQDLSDALKSLKARVRGIYDKEETLVKKFGKSLFQQVITGTVYALYKNGKQFSSNKECVLRLRLHLGSPELIELPWELLCEEGEFLALTTEHPRILVMRCLSEVKPIGVVEHHLPLQIAIMAAELRDQSVGAEREKDLISKSIEKVVEKGHISIKDMQGNYAELAKIRNNRTLNIFHFIGHGSFNTDTEEGELILEDDRTIPGYVFSKSLPNSVKLVFLNACESARGSASESSSSIAYILAKQRRVVIAMQFRITVEAAVHFASVFYSEIAKGMPIDEAVTEARLSVFTMEYRNPLDWAAPVLYMKSDNGVLFDIKDPSPSISIPDEEDTEQADNSSQATLTNTQLPPLVSSLRRHLGDVNSFRQKYPKPLAACALALVLIPFLIIWFLPFIPIRKFSSSSTPTIANCNIDTTVSPHPQLGNATPELDPFVNVPGLKESRIDACHHVIGLSAGSTIFDTASADNDEMQKGATALRNGDLSGALSHFTGVTTTDPLNAEAWIYAQNLQVLIHRLDYVAVILGVTSGNNGSFRDSMQGAYLAQAAYNQAAPQQKWPSLVLIIANSGAVSANTTWVAQQILALKKANSHIVGMIGWAISSDSVNANALLAHRPVNQDDVFMLSPSATSKDLQGAPEFSRIIPSDRDQTNYMADYAYTTLKYRKIAIFYASNDDFITSSYASFKEAFLREQNTKVVSEQRYTQGDTASLRAALSNALQSHPDGIYFAGFAADAGLLLSLPQIASLPAPLKILGSSALSLLSDYPANQPNMDRLVFTSLASQDEWKFLHHEQLPFVSTFLSEYQRTFQSRTLTPNVILNYDAVQVFLHSYQLALATGTVSCLPCALENALQEMHGTQIWQGISGQIAFENGSTEPTDKIILLNIIENGTTKTLDYRGCFLADRTDCKD